MSSNRRHRRSSRRRRNRRIIWWSVAGVSAVLIAAVAWIGVRAWLAYGELQTARSGAASLQTELLENPDAAEASIAALGQHTKRAAALTSDPVWRGAEALPWAGKNLEAFRVTAWSLDTVVRSVAEPLAGQVSGLQESLKPVDGRIDTARLSEMQPVSEQSEAWMQEVQAAMRGIDRESLVPQLATAVEEFDALLAPISEGVGAIHGATTLVPALLGSDGQRDTLLLFLNNAELRSTVGIPGAFALVSATDGKLSLTQQASTREFRQFDAPITALPEDIRGVYGDRPALWIQNVTMLPEFPLSGELAATMWEAQFGVRPQTVVALDPFTLSYLLEATGPIELATGDVLTSDNAVELLLHEVYLRYEEPAMQDALFAEASERVFDAVASGRFDTTKLIAALAQGVQENRVKLWSAVTEEQLLIERTLLGGMLPKGNANQAAFAMHLNDGTGSKMDYYLATETEVVADMCPAPGLPETVTVRYTITNTAPADAAAVLPWYITGGGVYNGVNPGEISTVARLFAPPGFTLQHKTVDDQVENAGIASSLFDRSLVIWDPKLAPGQHSTIEITYTSTEHRGADVVWQQTPTFYHTFTKDVGMSC